MTTFEFTTPDLTQRDPQTLTVDLCGEHLRLERPKDFAMRSLATVLTDEVPMFDRAQAILNFLLGVFTDEQYRRFIVRCVNCDDPLDLEALVRFLGAVADRWSAFDQHATTHGTRLPDTANPTITITAPPHRGILGGPVRIKNHDLRLDVNLSPPKNILIMIVFAYSGGDASGQHWAIEVFLEATFPRAEFVTLKRRLMSRTDPLDVPHLDTIVGQLIDHWSALIDLPDIDPTDTNTENNPAATQQATGTL